MKSMTINVPKGMVVDEEKSTFTNIVFKEAPKVTKGWEDLNGLEGWWVGEDSVVKDYDGDMVEQYNRNIWATKEQAEACLAMSMLSQLMKNVNGDWTPDWSDWDEDKHVIELYDEDIDRDSFVHKRHFLAFQRREIRDKFAEDHANLILQAAPLL